MILLLAFSLLCMLNPRLQANIAAARFTISPVQKDVSRPSGNVHYARIITILPCHDSGPSPINLRRISRGRRLVRWWRFSWPSMDWESLEHRRARG